MGIYTVNSTQCTGTASTGRIGVYTGPTAGQIGQGYIRCTLYTVYRVCFDRWDRGIYRPSPDWQDRGIYRTSQDR